MIEQHATVSSASAPAGRGGRILLPVAFTVFLAGLLAIAATFVYAAVTGDHPPLSLYLVSMLCPVGFLLCIAGALRSGRRART